MSSITSADGENELFDFKVVSTFDNSEVTFHNLRRSLLCVGGNTLLSSMFSGEFKLETEIEIDIAPAHYFAIVIDSLRLMEAVDDPSAALKHIEIDGVEKKIEIDGVEKTSTTTTTTAAAAAAKTSAAVVPVTTTATTATTDGEYDESIDNVRIDLLFALFDYIQLDKKYVFQSLYTRCLARYEPTWLATKREDDLICVSYVKKTNPQLTSGDFANLECVYKENGCANDSWRLRMPHARIPVLFQTWGVFDRLHQSNVGKLCVVPTLKEAMDSFHRDTHGIFKGFNFRAHQMVVAGGAALAAVMATTKHGLTGKIGGSGNVSENGTANRFFNDVDLFCYGMIESEASEKVRSTLSFLTRRLEELQGSKYVECCIVRTRLAVTWCGRVGTLLNYGASVSKSKKKKEAIDFPRIQIVLRIYKTPAEIVSGFDIDAPSVLFTGDNFYCCRRARRALETRTNLVDLARLSPTYSFRLYKYALRGFAVAVPGHRSQLINEEIFNTPAIKLNGLAQLLTLEQRHYEPRCIDLRAIDAALEAVNGEKMEQHSIRKYFTSSGILYGRRVRIPPEEDKSDKWLKKTEWKLGDTEFLGRPETEVNVESLKLQRSMCDYTTTFLPVTYSPLELLSFLGAREVIFGDPDETRHPYYFRRRRDEDGTKTEELERVAVELGYVHTGPRNLLERRLGFGDGWDLQPIFDSYQRCRPTPLKSSGIYGHHDTYAWAQNLKRSVPRYMEDAWVTKNPSSQRLTGSFHPIQGDWYRFYSGAYRLEDFVLPYSGLEYQEEEEGDDDDDDDDEEKEDEMLLQEQALSSGNARGIATAKAAKSRAVDFFIDNPTFISKKKTKDDDNFLSFSTENFASRASFEGVSLASVANVSRRAGVTRFVTSEAISLAKGYETSDSGDKKVAKIYLLSDDDYDNDNDTQERSQQLSYEEQRARDYIRDGRIAASMKGVAFDPPSSSFCVTLNTKPLTIGSSPECNVRIFDDSIAPLHATIDQFTVFSQRYWLHMNVPMQPKEPIPRPVPLENGEVFVVGACRFLFVDTRPLSLAAAVYQSSKAPRIENTARQLSQSASGSDESLGSAKLNADSIQYTQPFTHYFELTLITLLPPCQKYYSDVMEVTSLKFQICVDKDNIGSLGAFISFAESLGGDDGRAALAHDIRCAFRLRALLPNTTLDRKEMEEIQMRTVFEYPFYKKFDRNHPEFGAASLVPHDMANYFVDTRDGQKFVGIQVEFSFLPTTTTTGLPLYDPKSSAQSTMPFTPPPSADFAHSSSKSSPSTSNSPSFSSVFSPNDIAAAADQVNFAITKSSTNNGHRVKKTAVRRQRKFNAALPSTIFSSFPTSTTNTNTNTTSSTTANSTTPSLSTVTKKTVIRILISGALFACNLKRTEDRGAQ